MVWPRKIHSKSRYGNVCPCCGHEVDKSKLIIDGPTGVVIFNGMIQAVPNKMAELLSFLWNAYPNAVQNSQIVYEWYAARGKEEPENGNAVLGVVVANERQKLLDMGIEIIRCRVDGLHGKRLKLTTFGNAKDGPLAANQHAQLMWG